MNYLKKLLAILLAMVMVLSLAACGGNANSGSGESADTRLLSTAPRSLWRRSMLWAASSSS